MHLNVIYHYGFERNPPPAPPQTNKQTNKHTPKTKQKKLSVGIGKCSKQDSRDKLSADVAGTSLDNFFQLHKSPCR